MKNSEEPDLIRVQKLQNGGCPENEVDVKIAKGPVFHTGDLGISSTSMKEHTR